MKHFVMGAIIGFLTVIFAFVILRSVLGSANVTMVEGTSLNAANTVLVVVIYGLGTVILGWLATILGKMMYPTKRRK